MAAPIISRQDLSDYLARDVTTDDGALAVVDASSEVCRSIAQQAFNKVEDEEITIDGPGTDVIILPELPVLGVSSLLDRNGDEVDADRWALTGIGTLVRIQNDVWTKGRQNFTITYTHGYEDADIPRDVRMVALNLAARIFLQGPVVFETIGSRQVRYAGPPMELTNTEKAILRLHKPTT